MLRPEPALPRPAQAAPARPGARLRILIVGGGASGVLLAAQLLRKGGDAVAVRIIERGEMLGCGVAYATRDPAHLLNTRVTNMSAFPHLPDHFLDWLRAREPDQAEPQGFVSRATYGRYMHSLLDDWQGARALACDAGDCVALEVGPAGVAARLASGERIEADLSVLATGHALPEAGADSLLTQPWDLGRPPTEAEILIVGSGLTMVDQVLSLLDAGHRGRITAVSRRGLLPQVHASTDPACFRAEELPPSGRVAPLMRWLRSEARAREAAGGDWRDVVDGIRPHLQAIWRGLPPAGRRSFLRHAGAYWEVHRHRMPPSSRERLERALTQGRLALLRASFDGAARDGAGRLEARLRRRDGRRSGLVVDRIVDCRGIRRDPEAHATPLISGLLASGTARIDPLRIGLDVAADCAVVDRDGRPSGRLFALGPASRAAFWEITAIPDIRAQAARLADRLLGTA